MGNMRLALIGALAVLFTLASASSASAAASVETFPVSFQLTSATCPNLPDGTVINGTGTGKSITVEHATSLFNVTHDQGTATDQDGNQYVFSYSNTFHASATSDPGVLAGRMVDHFSLSGSGPASLNNGFVANFETDFATFFAFDPISSHGDPLVFPQGDVACDPL